MEVSYIRSIGRDTWHWRPDCHWAKIIRANGRFKKAEGKPKSGEKCDECLAKERKANRPPITDSVRLAASAMGKRSVSKQGKAKLRANGLKGMSARYGKNYLDRK